MNYLKQFLPLTVAVFAFLSCQQELTFGTDESDVFNAMPEAFVDSSTKTSLASDNVVVWSGGDRISIFEGSDARKVYEIDSMYVGSASGRFVRVDGMEANEETMLFDRTLAAYPYSEDLSVGITQDGTLSVSGVDFHSEQHYREGSFSEDSFPMLAVSPLGERSIAFKNIGGLIKLSMTGNCSVVKIMVEGNNGEPLSGLATVVVGENGVPFIESWSEASSAVSIICEPAVTLDPETETSFYISVPPTQFDEGFVVTVTDSEGRTMAQSTTNTNTVNRSTILSMPAFYVEMQLDAEATENYIRVGDIVSYDASTGTAVISKSSDDIPAVGNAFVLPDTYGYGIRVVEEVEVISDDKVQLRTVQGNISNVFKNTSFTLATAGHVATKSAVNGPVVTPSSIGYYDDFGQYQEVYNNEMMTKASYTKDFALWSIGGDYGGISFSSALSLVKYVLSAELNGVFEFDFGEKVISEVRKVGDLKRFKYTLEGKINHDVLWNFNLDGSFSEGKDEIVVRNAIKPIVIKFLVSGVPVVMTVYTHLGKSTELTANGEVDVNFEYGFNAGFSMGLEWVSGGGAHPVYSAELSLNTPELSISASADLMSKVSYYPRIEIKLYDLIGPWAEMRPYLKENVKAGAMASTSGDRYVGWTSDTYSGFDAKLGLNVGFGAFSDEVCSTNVLNLVGDTPLFHAPYRISHESPESGLEITAGESVSTTFLVESYSPLTGRYYPCPGAFVNYQVDGGEANPSVSMTDMSGYAYCSWATDIEDEGELTMTASIVNSEGGSIDEAKMYMDVTGGDRIRVYCATDYVHMYLWMGGSVPVWAWPGLSYSYTENVDGVTYKVWDFTLPEEYWSSSFQILFNDSEHVQTNDSSPFMLSLVMFFDLVSGGSPNDYDDLYSVVPVLR